MPALSSTANLGLNHAARYGDAGRRIQGDTTMARLRRWLETSDTPLILCAIVLFTLALIWLQDGGLAP